MRKLILAISALALATSAVLADPIADRKALMKERGKAVGGLVQMVKGEERLRRGDGAGRADGAATTTPQKIDVDALFPAGSESGDTKASPKIWEDMAGFQAAVDKFKADTAAAVAAAAAGSRGAEGATSARSANCGACHQTFRIERLTRVGLLSKAGGCRRCRWARRRRGVWFLTAPERLDAATCCRSSARAMRRAASGSSGPAAARPATPARNPKAMRGWNWPAGWS